MPSVARLHRLAELDIRAAALWYDSRREGLGAEFVLELDVLCERIVANPDHFPSVGGGIRRALLRRFPYAVYFAADGVPTIVAVLHQHRDPRAWQHRG